MEQIRGIHPNQPMVIINEGQYYRDRLIARQLNPTKPGPVNILSLNDEMAMKVN
jgi:hypothetical protein